MRLKKVFCTTKGTDVSVHRVGEAVRRIDAVREAAVKKAQVSPDA
jgi:hypothetical protein